jgi:hypothetical protein
MDLFNNKTSINPKILKSSPYQIKSHPINLNHYNLKNKIIIKISKTLFKIIKLNISKFN